MHWAKIEKSPSKSQFWGAYTHDLHGWAKSDLLLYNNGLLYGIRCLRWCIVLGKLCSTSISLTQGLLPPPWWRLCFHRCPLVCLFVSLSVCLLATLRKTAWTDFHDIQGRQDLIQGTSGNIFRMFDLTPWTHDFFPPSRRNACLLAASQKNGSTDFQKKFSKRTDMTHGTIWSIFAMLRLTPWILGRFIYFLDPCLFVISWKNGWADFRDFLWNVRHDTRKK